MNDDEMTLLLLQTIRVNGNTMYLLRHGYTLYSLSESIDSLKEKGFVRSKKDQLSLTKDGESLFCALNRKLGRKGFYKFISRMGTFIDEPMPLNAVYVPVKESKRKEEVKSIS